MWTRLRSSRITQAPSGLLAGVSPSLRSYVPVCVVDYYRCHMQIGEGFRNTKATHYGLDVTDEGRIPMERRANLLWIAALMIFALWLIGANLKGTEIERHSKVNSGPRSSYSVIFLERIAYQYVVFALPVPYLACAQARLVSYFKTLEAGSVCGDTSESDTLKIRTLFAFSCFFWRRFSIGYIF